MFSDGLRPVWVRRIRSPSLHRRPPSTSDPGSGRQDTPVTLTETWTLRCRPSRHFCFLHHVPRESGTVGDPPWLVWSEEGVGPVPDQGTKDRTVKTTPTVFLGGPRETSLSHRSAKIKTVPKGDGENLGMSERKSKGAEKNRHEKERARELT